jgi:hypothetical protein
MDGAGSPVLPHEALNLNPQLFHLPIRVLLGRQLAIE